MNETILNKLKLFLKEDIGGYSGFDFISIIHPFLLECCIVNGYHNLPRFTYVKGISNTLSHSLFLVLSKQNLV